jgi:segregation and condensation protein B
MLDYNKKYAIEAILFVAGEEIHLKKIAQGVNLSLEDAKKLINELSEEYDESKRGYEILSANDYYQLASRKWYADIIVEVFENKRRGVLSQSALEILSIVAYRQPITRVLIDEYRGVNSSGTIQRLVDQNLIEVVGRLEVPGRPNLYGTTNQFLKSLGIPSLDDLPSFDLFNETADLTDEEKDFLNQKKE